MCHWHIAPSIAVATATPHSSALQSDKISGTLYYRSQLVDTLVGPDGTVAAKFAEPFNMLVEPVKDKLARLNSSKDNEEVHEHLLMDFLSSIPSRLSNFFGKGWSKNFLVRKMGLEPTRAHCSQDP